MSTPKLVGFVGNLRRPSLVLEHQLRPLFGFFTA